MLAEPTPFRIAIPQADMADLGARLERTRWPEPETVGDWSLPLIITHGWPPAARAFLVSCSGRPGGGRSGVSRTSATGVNRPEAAISLPLSSQNYS